MRSSSSFESLESRRLLSASVTSNGTLKVVGEEDAANTINVAYNSTTSQYDVTFNGETSSFDADSVRRLRISGGDEADTITVDGSVKVRASINGNDGDDVLTAGSKRTAINGGAGNDTITGSAKSDTLRGGDGDDSIDSGAGDDRVSGGDGNDVITAGAGDNEVAGGAGDDTITSLDGDDVIVGGDGTDSIDSGTGDDDVTEDNLDGSDDGEGCDGIAGEIHGPRHGRHDDSGSTDSSTTTTRAFSFGQRGPFGSARIF